MPSALRPVSIPLATADFLRASHFHIGDDQSSSVVSPYRTEYPPRWGRYQREAIKPPKCAGVLNQDMGQSQDSRSETVMSYPSWPLEPRSIIRQPASCIQMHADPCHRLITSVTQESYPYPDSTPHVTLNRVDKWDDRVPSGDKEKQPLPNTQYQQSYPAYKELPPVIKASCRHLGGVPTVRGDGGNYYNTTYQSMFRGEWAPPDKRCNGNLVSVLFGDPQHVQTLSEQKRAYTVQKSEGQRYDPNIASAMVRQTNIRPGDGQHRFSTIMSESYLWNQPESSFRSDQRKNTSYVILGNQNERNINMTNHQFYYQEPNAKDLVNQPVRQPLTQLCLGDDHMPPSFNTTQKLDYQPYPETRKFILKDKGLPDSNICLKYKGPGAPDFTTIRTTTQDMPAPPQTKKYQPTEEELQRIKYSHFIPPWKEQRWFGTEQRDAYTDKYKGPITLAFEDIQKSSVPLGTMAKYQTRKKFAS